MARTVEYVLMPQGAVLQEYSRCRTRNKFIIGPLGSGKTVQTILDILDLICEQAPCEVPNHKNYGIRLSRWIAARNTYSELFSTTIKDWLEIHGDLGNFKQGGKEPPTHSMQFRLEDDTAVRAEIIFIAFDRPDHVKKARGIQATGIWLNEAKEHRKSVVDMLDLRHGRYPSRKEGALPTWHGMLGDSNAPDEDHWLYEMAEQQKPKDWTFFKQPGGLMKDKLGRWVPNPEAENVKNLPGGFEYYLRGMQGKTEDWVKVNLANEYGYVSDGKPVHPRYVDSVHCVDLHYTPHQKEPIVLGFDFGRTPACAMIQRDPTWNRWIQFDEFTSENMSATSFAPALKKYLSQQYPNHKFKGWGDPAGNKAGEAVDDSPMKILRAAGIPCNPTRSNVTLERRTALETPMTELCMDGRPRFLLLPKCKMTRKGLRGGFCYKRIQVSGEKYADAPDKNEFSHVCEALEYALQGEGEAIKAMTPAQQHTGPVPVASMDFNVFD